MKKDDIDALMTPDLVEISRLHGEVKATRLEKINELRKLIKSANFKILPDIKDGLLINFLRCLDFDVNQAFICFQEYCKSLHEVPSLLDPRLPLQLGYAFEWTSIVPLPYSDKHGNMMFLITVGQWDPDKLNADDLFRTAFTVMTHSFMHPRSQLVGLVTIMDLEGLAFRHFKALKWDAMRRCINLYEKAFPVNCRAVHIYNNNIWAQMAYNLFKPLMSRKLRNMIHWHGTNLKSLQDAIGVDSLPDEYGGTQPSPNAMEYYNEMCLTVTNNLETPES